MKKILLITSCLLLATGASACNPEEPPPASKDPKQPRGNDNLGDPTDPSYPGENQENMALNLGSNLVKFVFT